MEMKGDIHVWTDSNAAHATLTLEGQEGQVTIAAQTPLAGARKYIHRLLAERGEDLSGVGDERLGQLTNQMGRSRVLGLLRSIAPVAFNPGGYATMAVARRLGRRRRPAAPPRGIRQGRAPMEALSPGPLPEEVPDHEDREDETSHDQETSRGTTGAAEVDVGAPTVPPAALAASPQLAAGAALLSAARTNPKAARKVRNIFRRAKDGHPQAQKSAHVLVAAKKAEKDQQAAMRALVRKGTEPPPSAGPLPPKHPVTTPSLPPLPAEVSLPVPRVVLPRLQRRASHIFETWRRGIV